MSCWFGHKPHLGFSSKWELKEYQVFMLINPEGWTERRLYRTHVCENCGSLYYEVKHIDSATEQALKLPTPEALE